VGARKRLSISMLYRVYKRKEDEADRRQNNPLSSAVRRHPQLGTHLVPVSSNGRVTHSTQPAWGQKMVEGALFMDVKSAFNSVRKAHLGRRM
jgi:hypothetical protein